MQNNLFISLLVITTAITCNANDLLKLFEELQKLKPVDLSNFIGQIIENVRQDMISSHKIDPIILDKRLENTITNSKTDVKIVIEPGFKVEGLSGIKIDNLKVEINPKTFTIALNIGFTVPSVRGSGKYLLNGKAFKYIPIRGNGSATIQIEQLVGKFDSILLKFDGVHFKTDSLKMNATIGSLKLNLENLIDPSLSQFLNSILNFLAKPLVDNLLLNNKQKVISLEDKLKESLNKELSKYSIEDLMKKFNIN